MPNKAPKLHLTVEQLLRPAAAKQTDRRAWGIPVNGVWVPFFMATNATGTTSISPEALGYPTRLAKDSDGQIRISKSTNQPIVKVVKELSDSVRLIRENFTAGLLA